MSNCEMCRDKDWCSGEEMDQEECPVKSEIEHQWIRGNHHIPTVMKNGSLSRAIWVCKDCGKRKVF